MTAYSGYIRAWNRPADNEQVFEQGAENSQDFTVRIAFIAMFIGY